MSIWIMALAILMVLVPNFSPVSGTDPSIVFDSIDVEMIVGNHYAVTDVTKTVRNTADQMNEVVHYFRIPRGSFLSNLSLVIDEQTFYADVVEKQTADQQYDDAKDQNKTAIKLSGTIDPYYYSINLNIGPESNITLSYRYEQVLWKNLGEYSISVPMHEMGDYTSFEAASFKFTMRAPVPITSFTHDSTNIDLQEESPQGNSIKLYNYGFVPASNDNIEITFEEQAPPVDGSLYGYEDGTGGYFMHVFSPQLEDLGNYMPKDICFVLDRSGSMAGTKIDQLKDAFDEIVHQLHEEDRFNVITFSADVTPYSTEIMPATSDNTDDAAAYINEIIASGSTNIDQALLDGLKIFDDNQEAVPIIVFLTDGLPSAGVTNTAAIRENIKGANTGGVSIYSLGFGQDLDFDFLNALSLENNGVAVSIPEGSNAAHAMTGFYDTVSIPLLKDIQFQYSMGTNMVMPTWAPSLFHGSEIVVVGRYDNLERITSTVTAQTAEGTRVFEESFPTVGDYDMPFIRRLWAQRQILFLMDQIAINGENDTTIQKIVDLGVQYSFVTPYTSMILVVAVAEDEALATLGGEVDTNEPALRADDENYGKLDGGGTSYDPQDSWSHPAMPAPGDDGEEMAALSMSYLPMIAFIVVIIALLIIGIVGYSRLKAKDLLDQENRKKIYEYIMENPGDHFREVQREMELEVGVLSHHVNILEKEQLIVSEQDGMYRRFYAAGVKRDDKVRLSRIQENILKSIQHTPGITQTKIAKEVGVSRKVVYYHVKFLTGTGLVEEQKVKRKPHYYPA
ncbi:MAG: VWA domain-containing protein [Thermoplasmata archaeon]|nr:VWA domain-containing protein [Thermoplasmata archaeon]